MARLDRKQDRQPRKTKFPSDIRYLLLLNIALNIAVLYFLKY